MQLRTTLWYSVAVLCPRITPSTAPELFMSEITLFVTSQPSTSMPPTLRPIVKLAASPPMISVLSVMVQLMILVPLAVFSPRSSPTLLLLSCSFETLELKFFSVRFLMVTILSTVPKKPTLAEPTMFSTPLLTVCPLPSKMPAKFSMGYQSCPPRSMSASSWTVSPSKVKPFPANVCNPFNWFGV